MPPCRSNLWEAGDPVIWCSWLDPAAYIPWQVTTGNQYSFSKYPVGPCRISRRQAETPQPCTRQLQLTGSMGISRHRPGEASSSHFTWCKCPFLPCAVMSFSKYVAKAYSQGWLVNEGNSHLSLTGLLTTKTHLLLLHSLCAPFMWPTKCH